MTNMMTPTTSMPLASDYTNCLFTPPSLMTFPWIQHSPPLTPLKGYTPHVPYPTPRLAHNSGITFESSVHPPQPIQQQQQQQLTVKKKNSRKLCKSSYKHVPHKDKPPHLVARRNARERRRVQAVNSAFARLRKCVPVENRSKRLSKVKTLHRAIEYINGLQNLLNRAGADGDLLPPPPAIPVTPNRDEDDDAEDLEDEEDDDFQELDDYLEIDVEAVNKENDKKSWIPLGTALESGSYHEQYAPYYQDYSGNMQS